MANENSSNESGGGLRTVTLTNVQWNKLYIYASRNASLSSMTSIIFIMRSRFSFGVLFSSSTMCSGFSVTSASPPFNVVRLFPPCYNRGRRKGGDYKCLSVLVAVPLLVRTLNSVPTAAHL